MPHTNYTWSDLLGSYEATLIFALIAIVPGYVIGWISDLFGFRRRSVWGRVSIAVVTSVLACPITTFLLGMFVSMSAAWTFYAAAWVGFIVLTGYEYKARRLPRLLPLPKYVRAAGLIALAWSAVAIFSLVDLQIGDRLYFPTSVYDYNTRTALVNEITRTGLPPHNPFYYPGHFVTLRYHYFWYLMCSLVDHAGGSAISPHHAIIAGTVWAGFALLAAIALFVRILMPGDGQAFGRRMIIAFALLAVTGLDLIPTFLLLVIGVMYPDPEWWNNQITAWVGAVLWVPHHVVGLVMCSGVFLIAFQTRARWKDWRRFLIPSVIAALGVASIAGTSIYLAFVVGVSLAIWFTVVVWKRWLNFLPALTALGIISLILAAPYLNAVRTSTSKANPIVFQVRIFDIPYTLLTDILHMNRWKADLTNAVLLPVNYVLELGLFCAIGFLGVRQLIRQKSPLQSIQWASLVFLLVPFLLCTLLATVPSNDLGWRGFLLVQFVLLLWTVGAVERWLDHRSGIGPGLPRWLTRVMPALLLFGVLGSLYSVALQRLYPILLDHNLAPAVEWLSKDTQLGPRTYAVRSAFELLDRQLPEHAIVQSNPVTRWDLFHGSYSNRQTVAFNPDCVVGFGGDPGACEGIRTRIQRLFTEGSVTVDSVRRTCRDLSIDVLFVKDTDPVWVARKSWVWSMKPVLTNSHVRALACKEVQ
jgi:hypothetical protein